MGKFDKPRQQISRPAGASDSLRQPATAATVTASPPGAVAAANASVAQTASPPVATVLVAPANPIHAAAASTQDATAASPADAPAAIPAAPATDGTASLSDYFAEAEQRFVDMLKAGVDELGTVQGQAEAYAKAAVQAGNHATHALHSKLATAVGEFRNALKTIFA